MRILRSVAMLLAVCSSTYAQSVPSGESSPGQGVDSRLDLASHSGLYVKVQLENNLKVAALKPGDVINGKLAQDVYSGDRELFPAASRVRLTVDRLSRRRRLPNDHWPWVVKVFTPRHENYPTFRCATVTLSDGNEVPLRVSLIRIDREREILAQTKAKKEKAVRPASQPLGPIVSLEAANPSDALAASEQIAISGESSSGTASPGPVTLAAGTRAKIILLGGVSASKSQPGDSFQARLVEPVRLDSKVVLPEGTLLGGKVVKRTPPRVLSRAGSIMLTFTDLTLPGRPGIPAAASVTAVEVDQRAHTRIDPEGILHGDRPGKAWMAINIGVTAGIAKEADDTIQLIIEAVVSSATDASTSGVGKIVATCASGLFLLTRHGRDVVLPRFTEMNIVFDRSLSLPGSQPSSAP